MKEVRPNYRADRRSKTEFNTTDVTIVEYKLSPNLLHKRYQLSPVSLSSANTSPKVNESTLEKPQTRLNKEVYLEKGTSNAY